MGNFLNNKNDKNKIYWFVMLAYKKEKAAEDALSGNDGLKYFIPKCCVVKSYHGKKRKHLVPCIPSIIFVHASHAQILKFKEKYNFLKFVIWNKSTGKEYLIVRNDKMEDFIKISSSYEKSVRYYKPEEVNLLKGSPVRIHGGQFDGVEGTFVKVAGKRSRQVVVIIPDLLAVSVEVSPDLIEVLS